MNYIQFTDGTIVKYDKDNRTKDENGINIGIAEILNGVWEGVMVRNLRYKEEAVLLYWEDY